MRGFTLLELMIAMTIGVFLLGTLAVVLVNNSRTRYELEQSIGQIQNARYALQVLSDDVANAGFYGEAQVTGIANLSDPICSNISDMSQVSNLTDVIRGRNNITASQRPGCTPDALEGLDILAVRRASTCAVDTVGCDAFLAGLPHLQKPGCGAVTTPTIATTRNAFTGTRPPCDATPTQAAPIYRLVNHVYYLRNVTVSSQSIPTLMRAELTGNGYQSTPIAEGIEHLHFEYGVDTDPIKDGEPNRYRTSNNITGTDWGNVVSVRVYLIARNLKRTSGYQDTRTYQLGGASVTPSGEARGFKRQAYSTTIRLNNIAGPLE
ncbi:PilW family protein [Thiocapsa sp.]|uniref:PilW family protein n=1 Tax=Thiocapsa sp. TaxID=2024551 RepID=UPI001BCE0E70|nr:PilW family protein [Thiocapsa sp.]